MGFAKKIARNIVLPLALRIGVDKYFLRKNVKSVCIVNFHGVRELETKVFNNRHMPVKEFEKIIKYFQENYDIISLTEAFKIHRKQIPVKRKTLVLTFDDGYENNFKIALPILKKYNVPATFYIITKGLTSENYLAWPDVIDIIKKNTNEDLTINGQIFKYPGLHNEKLRLNLPDYLKQCGDKTESLAYELLAKYDFKNEEMKKFPELLRLIDGSEISKYSDEPLIEFGSHTHNHYCLEYLDTATAEKELKYSKEILESKTGKSVNSLAFPDGSYKPETLEIAKRCGYDNSVAVYYKLNENNKDPDLLSRFTISNSTTFESNILRLAKDFDRFAF